MVQGSASAMVLTTPCHGVQGAHGQGSNPLKKRFCGTDQKKNQGSGKGWNRESR